MARRIFAVAVTSLALAAIFLPLAAQDKAGPALAMKLKGHTDAVYAVAFSPDGKYVATASFDSTLKLWDAVTGKEIKTYGGTGGHTKQVISLAFSPDGTMLASGSTDNTLKVWDVPVNVPIRSLKANDAVTAVALSPDGTKLALAGKDGSLRLVTAAEFKDLVKFEPGHQGEITGLAFTANGQTLASVGADRTLRTWNALTGQPIATVGAHTAGVNGVAINPGGAAAYTVGDDGFLKFWTMPATASKTVPGQAGPVRALALSPDNTSYYTGAGDKTVRQFALQAAKETRSLAGPAAAITSVAAHPQNAFVAAGTQDSRIFLWNNADPKTPASWLAHGGVVTSVQVNAPGTQLMSAGEDGLVKFWALPAVPPRTLTHPDTMLAVAASPDGKKIFTGSADKLVRSWDAAKQAMEKQFAGHTAAVTAVAVSPNLQVLASGGADNTIRIWNQAMAKESDVLIAHAAPLSALSINAAGTQMLSAGEDGSVKVWALPLTQPKLFTHPDAIAAVALSGDAGKMLTGGGDKIVRLWNLASGTKEKEFAGPTLPIQSVAIAGNAATVAAASADKTVTLWNAGDAKLLHKLPMPAGPQALAFSGDAQSIFVGLADNSIKQIKIADGKEIKTLPAQHKGPIVALAVSLKGDMLFSASADKTIQTWTLPDGMAKAKFEHAGPITAFALSKDGTRIAAAADKLAKIWTVADGKEVGAIALAGEAKSLALSPDGTRLVVAGADKLARVYGLDSKLLEILPHDGAVQAAAFVDAKKVVTAGADKLARLWTSSLLWQGSHQGPVRQALFTPKGDQVITAGDDKAIKVWNAADGKEIKSLAADGPIAQLSVNGDGTKIASAGADKSVKIWTVADGKATTISLPAIAQGISLSPNGQRVAIALAEGPGNVIRVHDLGLGKDVQIFADHAGPIKALRFLGDGRTLISASADKTARVFDVGVVALAAHPAGPTFAQYHGNAQQLITAGADKTIRLWDLAKMSPVKSFGPLADPIKAIALSKDFTKVGVAAGKTVRVFALADGKESAPLNHSADVLSLSFSPDGTRIATGSVDKQTRIWDAAAGKELQFFAQDEAVDAVIYAPAGNLVISAAGKSTRLDAPSIVRAMQADAGPTHAVVLIPANTHVLTGGADKTAKMWNLGTGALERSFAGAGAPLRAVAVAKNGQLVAAGGADQTVRVYQFADAKELGTVKAGGEVRALAFTPNSLALVGASLGKTLEAWSVPFAPGQPLAKDFLTPVQSFTTADVIPDFAIAADNASIYSAGQDKAVHVWKLASPAPTRNFNYGVNVDAVAFQPGAAILAATGHDGKIRLFDLVKNAQAKDITAHIRDVNKQQVPQPIYALSYSADGKKMLSASYDGSLKLWDASGTLLKEFKAYKEKEFDKGHQEPVYAAALSPDGKFIASGSSGLERTIKIWSIDGSVVRDLANPNFKSAPGFPPESHPGGIVGLRFTKDGKYLISAGDAPGNKGFLAVWDWQAGKMVYDNTSLNGVYYGLALSPDDKLIAVAAGNRDRKLASPEFNAAYLFKMPMLGK